MNRIERFVKRNINTIFAVFGCVVVVATQCVTFVSLDKNLIPSDEGWYLCLLRDIPQFGITRFHLLFHNVFGNNIYAIRLCNWLLQFFGAFFLAFGIGRFVLRHLLSQECSVQSWQVYLLSVGIIFCGQMNLVACPSLNYLTLNKAFAEFGMGFLLLGLSQEKWIYYVCSGWAMAHLFPIMITNVIIIPVMCVVIGLLSSSKKKHLLCFIVGILFFVAYYLTFVEKPQSVFAFLLKETTQTVRRGGNDYGIAFLLKWSIRVVYYMCRCLLIATLLYAQYYIIRYKLRINRTWKIILFVCSTIILLGYLLKYVPPYVPSHQYGTLIWAKDILWILVFVDIIEALVNRKCIDKQRFVMGGCLLFMPIALSFGTNVPFYIRQGSYLLFVLPVLLFFPKNMSFYKKIVLLLVLIGQFVLFVHSWKGENWHGEKWFGYKEPVSSIGINQKVELDTVYIEKLDFCRQMVPKGRIMCDMENWGVVCLLDYIPVTYEFDITRLDMRSIQSIVNDAVNQDGELWIVCNRYSLNFIEKIYHLHGYKVEKYTHNNDLYFHLTIDNT